MKPFKALSEWLIRVVSKRKPDFIIGRSDTGEYLRRWWVIPRNPIFNVYLHNLLRSDADPEFHCHPWWNWSIILRGSYVERVPFKQGQTPSMDAHWNTSTLRSAGDVVFRKGTYRHRLLSPYDCWTLFITGPRYRTWGFWCRKGFVPWYDFVAQNDKGQRGRGCGEMS